MKDLVPLLPFMALDIIQNACSLVLNDRATTPRITCKVSNLEFLFIPVSMPIKKKKEFKCWEIFRKTTAKHVNT